MGSAFAKCCQSVKSGVKKTGSKASLFFRSVYKFSKDGLGKLGKIFRMPFTGTKNKKANPDQQKEDYKNPGKDEYKPGYYNIVAKPVDQKISKDEATEKINVVYDPGVDPNKKVKESGNKINFFADQSYQSKIAERNQKRRQAYEKDILKKPVVNEVTNNRPDDHPVNNPYNSRMPKAKAIRAVNYQGAENSKENTLNYQIPIANNNISNKVEPINQPDEWMVNNANVSKAFDEEPRRQQIKRMPDMGFDLDNDMSKKTLLEKENNFNNNNNDIEAKPSQGWDFSVPIANNRKNGATDRSKVNGNAQNKEQLDSSRSKKKNKVVPMVPFANRRINKSNPGQEQKKQKPEAEDLETPNELEEEDLGGAVEAIQVRPGEDYGEELPQIKHTSWEICYFGDEDDKQRVVSYSNNEVAIGTSGWVEFHYQIKGEFYDEDFGSKDRKTLYGLERCADQYDRDKLSFMDKLSWKRISYVYPDMEVIKDGIQNSDIYQGSLGDCYLLSSIASVSEKPNRIERLLLQRKRSPKGAYCIALCIVGEFREFHIDDTIPVLKGRAVFCHNTHGEMWALLIEKAYAKAYGGYWNIGAGGQSEYAMFDLTGAPTEFLRFETQEERSQLFGRILEADQKGFIMNASSKGSGESKNSSGIIAGHAYTLIAAFKLQNGDEVLKLRNPWGKGEWTGAYSDNSRLWTLELKRKMGWSNNDDGIFFMRCRDFMQHFEGVTICHYLDANYRSSMHDYNGNDSFACYQFNVEEEGDYYFGLSQPDKNAFKTGHTYGMLSIIVGRVEENGQKKVTYIGGKGYPRRDVWFRSRCTKGKYIAFVTTNWDNDNTDEFSIWGYGPKTVMFQRILKPANLKQCIELYKDTIVSKALLKKAEWNVFNPSAPWNLVKDLCEAVDDGVIYYIGTNDSEYDMTVTLNFNATQNVRIVYPMEAASSNQCVVTLGKEPKICILQVIDYPYSYSLSKGIKAKSRR